MLLFLLDMSRGVFPFRYCLDSIVKMTKDLRNCSTCIVRLTHLPLWRGTTTMRAQTHKSQIHLSLAQQNVSTARKKRDLPAHMISCFLS